jgi:hypothetical protein
VTDEQWVWICIKSIVDPGWAPYCKHDRPCGWYRALPAEREEE